MKSLFYKLLLVLVLYIAIFGCAKRGTPTGGAKDSIPPILINAIPAKETIPVVTAPPRYKREALKYPSLDLI